MFIFSSSGYLDVSVHRVIFAYSMYSSMDVRTLLLTGCPIRISAGLRLFPPYRSVSPVIASFIGFLCQGIHRMPLVTYPKYLLKSLLVSNCLLFRFVIISYYAFNKQLDKKNQKNTKKNKINRLTYKNYKER